MHLNPAEPTSAVFRDRISSEIDAFLTVLTDRLDAVSPALTVLTRVAADLGRGGKRLRPAFACWGHVAVADRAEIPDALWRAISAIELLHIGVLVHDDVLDAADTRRGRPAAHRQFEAWHREHGGSGDAAEFGRSMAVLLGDQLLVWSGELAETSGLDPETWRTAQPYWHAVRTEVNSGQVLDLCAQYRIMPTTAADDPPTAEQLATKVLEEKTSRYTVQRPLQFGAAAGGADPDVLAGLGRYGLALGRAFQLRDDLLGVFAAAETTGKPAAGDLREGKQTVLLARSLAAASPADRQLLQGLLGRPDLTDAEVAAARDVIAGSGAVESIEQTIADDCAAALAALDDIEISAAGRTALMELARQSVQREA